MFPGGDNQGLIKGVAFHDDKEPDNNSGITVSLLNTLDEIVKSEVTDGYGNYRIIAGLIL